MAKDAWQDPEPDGPGEPDDSDDPHRPARDDPAGEGPEGEGAGGDSPGGDPHVEPDADGAEDAGRPDPEVASVEPPVPVLRELTSERALVEHARTLGRDPAMAQVDDTELESLVRTGAAEVAALTCRWLEHLAELVVRGVWAEQGARTPGAWLSWAIGMGPSTAREHVRVALRLRDCPLVRSRFAAGTLSYSKVRALTRVATTETEEMLLRWADAAPAATIERIVRDARRVQRSGQPVAVRDDLGLHGRWRDDGSYELVVRVGATDGIELEQHLERLVELEERERYGRDDDGGREACEDGTDDAAHVGDGAGPAPIARVPRAVLAADALLEAVGRAATEAPEDATTLSTVRRDVVVHASTAAWASVTRAPEADEPDGTTPDDDPGGGVPTLTVVPPQDEPTPDEDGSASAEAPDGDAVPGPDGTASAEALDDARDTPSRRARAVRDGRGRPRLLRTTQLALAGCTARTWLLVDADEQHGGTPADLGRTRRDPDARLRRLLAARDVGCRFPGCGARRNLHAHHVTWWSRGGATDLDNLVLLCRAHHRAVHDDGWELRAAGVGRWTFHRPTPAGPDPTPLPWARPLPGASAEALAEVVRLHAKDLAPGALRPEDYDGSGYDHGLAVELLVAGLAEAV